MNDSDKVILVILGQSIRSEKAGNEFYDVMAARTSDPIGKELFQRLAVEEKNHEREMKIKYDEVADRCGWEPYEGAGTYKFLDHLDVNLPFLSEELPSLENRGDLSGRDALLMAILVEKASANYFLKAALAVEQTDAKAFFVDLAKSEVSHARILERELLRISSPK
ncbi:MAG: ferritin family protein [Planctomycetes bacterium]|nr:ferritin family protein [Planctomycetota bacterium]